jgi:hypothetical protein
MGHLERANLYLLRWGERDTYSDGSLRKS